MRTRVYSSANVRTGLWLRPIVSKTAPEAMEPWSQCDLHAAVAVTRPFAIGNETHTTTAVHAAVVMRLAICRRLWEAWTQHNLQRPSGSYNTAPSNVQVVIFNSTLARKTVPSNGVLWSKLEISTCWLFGCGVFFLESQLHSTTRLTTVA